MDGQRQQRHFEAIAQRYFTSRRSANHALFKTLLWGDFFRRNPFQSPGGMDVCGMDVLEPMCGYAEGKEIVERHIGVPVRYEGFDTSSTLIGLARDRFLDIHVERMDVLSWNPVPSSCDLVILLGGLHHVYRQAGDVVRSVNICLRDGGRFINFEPTYDNTLFRRIGEKVYRSNPAFDFESETRFSLAELNRVYETNGFRIVDQSYPGLLSYSLYYNPDVFPWLDIGKGALTRLLYSVDRLFFRSAVGRKLSFATLTLLEKARSLG